MKDIVKPNGNERELIEMGKRLGYLGVIFAYDFKDKKDFETKKDIAKKFGCKAIAIAKSVDVLKAKNCAELVLTTGTENNRELIEKYKPTVIFNLEGGERKDYTYFKNSGLTPVISEIANKNKIVIGYTYGELTSKKMGRMKQNMILGRKYKLKQIAFSLAENPYQMKNPSDVKALLTILGMSPGEAKKAVEIE